MVIIHVIYVRLQLLKQFSWLVLSLLFVLVIRNDCFSQLGNGLLLQYELDNNFLDASSNGFDGVGFNDTFVTNNSGNPLGALSANGTNTYVEFPNSAVLKPDFPITMATRVKLDFLGGTQIVAATDFGITTHSGAWIQTSSAGKITAAFGNAEGGFNGSTLHYKSVTNPVQADTWYFILAIIRGYQDIDIYIDCELQDGTYSGNAQSIGYTDAPGSLCRKRANLESLIPPYYFSGDVDYFYYWNRELDPDEIVPLCNFTICPGALTVEDTEGCVQSDLTYGFELTEETNSISEVLWTFFDGSESNSLTPIVSYDAAGTFPFSLQLIMDNGCVYSSEGNTTINEAPAPPVIPDSIVICNNDSYFLDFAEFSDWDVILNPNGDPVTSYTFSTVGNYIFSFSHLCAQIDVEVTVTEANSELIISGQTEYFACPNQPIVPNLNTNLSGNTYSWQPATGLSDPNALNPEITATQHISYTLTVSNPCAQNATYVLDIDMMEPLDFELIPELTICNGDTIEIPGQLNSEADVAWNNSNTLSELNIANPLAFPSSNTTYQITVSNQCETINQDFDIFVNDAPNITGTSHLSLCLGDTAYANIQNIGNTEVTSWNWTPAFGLTNSTISNPGIFNESNTIYQVEATNACGSDLFEIELGVFLLDAVLDLDSIICPGAPIYLSANGAESYTWFPENIMDNPHDSVTVAHIYSNQLIQLQISGGTCARTFSDFVQVYNNIGFSQLDAIHLYPGQFYDLSEIEWLYNITFSGSNQVSFTTDTLIALEYVDENGCAFYLNLPVFIEPALYVPNGFTPDGDGLNDIFKAKGVNIQSFNMRIYNRWGEQVFESNSLNHGWNGGLDGYYCPVDVYSYVIEYSYHTTEIQIEKGFVTLMR